MRKYFAALVLVLVAAAGLPLASVAAANAPDAPVITSIETRNRIAILTWDDVDGAVGYNIYRNGHMLETIPVGEMPYDDINAAGIYTYEVSAFDADNDESQRSEKVEADTTKATVWQMPEDEPPVVEEPVTEEAIVVEPDEEPVAEEPVTEEPVVEEPIAVEPAAERVTKEPDLSTTPKILTVETHKGLAEFTWDSIPGAVKYKIYRNGRNIETIPASEIPYDDRNAPGLYTYEISSIDDDGHESAKSDKVDVDTTQHTVWRNGITGVPDSHSVQKEPNAEDLGVEDPVVEDPVAEDPVVEETPAEEAPVDEAPAHEVSENVEPTIAPEPPVDTQDVEPTIALELPEDDVEPTIAPEPPAEVEPAKAALEAPVLSAQGGVGETVLSWDAVASATGYNIYRNNAYLTTTKVAGNTDRTRPGTYTYYVTAFDDSKTDFPKSNAVEATVVSEPVAVPDATVETAQFAATQTAVASKEADSQSRSAAGLTFGSRFIDRPTKPVIIDRPVETFVAADLRAPRLNVRSRASRNLLEWDKQPGAVKYNVYRFNQYVTTVTDNVWHDPNMGLGSYYVTAIDKDGNISTKSNLEVEVAKRPAVVAFGDSFISGEGGRWKGNGNGAINRGTGHYSGGSCHRTSDSPISYVNAAGVDEINIACSGAKASGMWDQVNQLRTIADERRVDMVLISAGGNDLGFEELLTYCIDRFFRKWSHSCAKKRTPWVDHHLPTTVEPAVNRLIDQVQAVLADQPNARIVIQSYPSPLPAANRKNAFERLDAGCPFRSKDMKWAEGHVSQSFDAKLKEIADKQGVAFLSMADAFDGKEVCSRGVTVGSNPASAEWVRKGSIETTRAVESFHPNFFGQQAMGTCISRMFNYHSFSTNVKGQYKCTNQGGLPTQMTLARLR